MDGFVIKKQRTITVYLNKVMLKDLHTPDFLERMYFQYKIFSFETCLVVL